MRRHLRALSITFMALAFALPAAAQEITATIAGTVTDQTGATLPGVSVTARNTGKGVLTEAVTTTTGRYTLPYLTNGEYEITFSMSGFKTYVAKNISLHVNDRLEVGAVLGVQGVTEAVEVTASAGLIQPSASVQNLMGATQVQELPLNNRNFVQLATLVPGVSSSLSDEVGIGLTNVVSLSINGARRNAINWFVDGASNVDVGSNVTLLSVPTLESIEEFKIITSSYSAEWPRSGGGIINVVTKQPQETPAYSLQQQFGSYNFFRTTGDATGPLSHDKRVLYRFNFAYENSESFRDFVDRKTMFFAPVVQWKVNSRTQITAELEYQNINTKSDGLLPALGNRPAPVPISRYLDEPSFSKSGNERFFTGINWSHELNSDWKITHRISGEFIHGLGTRMIVPFSAVDPASGNVDRFLVSTPRGNQENRYQSSLNLTGHVDTGILKHTLLFGYDYLYQTDKNVVSKCCDAGGPPFLPINVFNPVYGVGIPTLDQVPDNGPFGSSRSWHGFYLQDQVKLPLNLHLLAGLRYDDAVSNNTVLNERTGKDHRLSPRVGLVWQPMSWLSLYGSYTENFGLQNVFDIRRQPLPPQTAQQFEAGVKTEFFDGRLRTTVAYFDLTKQNVAVPDPANPQFSKALGEAQTRGIELDVSGELLPGWSVIASYTYMPFAKVTKDFVDDGGGGVTLGNTGNRLFNAAKDMGSLWSTYAFQDQELHGVKLEGLKIGAGLSAAGERQGDAANTFQMPGYVIANAMASYEWRMGMTKMTAQLNVSNLFDRTYYAGSNGGNYFIQPGMPRFFMGSIRMEF